METNTNQKDGETAGRPGQKSFVSNPIPRLKKSHHDQPHHHNKPHQKSQSPPQPPPQRATPQHPLSKQPPSIQSPTKHSPRKQPSPQHNLYVIPLFSTPPSISPPRLFSRSRSENRPSPPKDSKAYHRAKSVSVDEKHKELVEVALCPTEAEEPLQIFCSVELLNPLLNSTKSKTWKFPTHICSGVYP